MIPFAALALAALAGVLLAVLDRPHDPARATRASVLLLVACAITTAAGITMAAVD